MDLIQLKTNIVSYFKGNQDELNGLLHLIQQDKSIYPFNEYEYLISHLIHIDNLTFQDYLDIRSEYISANPNLWIFEISAPRGFGEQFAQTYLQGKCSNLKNASKKLDPNFKGQYDLFLDGIKIEVKASRVVDRNSKEPLYIKALSTSSKLPFLMNFQQLKPQYCDVFIWLAVFRDKIITWIINSKIIADRQLYSKGQHRGNIGNEGQLHITNENIHLFDEFKLKDNDLEKIIKKQNKSK